MRDNIIRIKELPAEERPREKLISRGAEALSNAELLAVLLGSGNREMSAVMLASSILASDPSGIRALNDCTPEELCRIPGIGEAKAATVIAAVELGRRILTAPGEQRINIKSPDDISSLFMERMRYLKKEYFKVLLLNVKNEIIAIDDVSIGSICSVEADPREVFGNPLRRGAANIILIHNHPSGCPDPSHSDVLLTRRMASAGEILGIEVLDHVIIGDGKYVSMKSRNLF